MNSYTLSYILSKVKIAVFLAIAVGLITYAVVGVSARAEDNSTDCLRNSPMTHASFTFNGNKATAHFAIPKGCNSRTVSLVSYKAPSADGHPYIEQTLFDSDTKQFEKTGEHEITITIPDCYYQLDLARGEPIQTFSHGHTYTQENRYLGSHNGGDKSCNPPAPAPAPAPVAPAAPAPSAPAPAPVTPAAPVTPPTTPPVTPPVTPPTTPVIPEQPKEEVVPGKNSPENLPNTGPGNIAAIFGAVTALSSLAYQFIARRFSF